jgi:hypothetical protein
MSLRFEPIRLDWTFIDRVGLKQNEYETRRGCPCPCPSCRRGFCGGHDGRYGF